jgi:hypothetical protein
MFDPRDPAPVFDLTRAMAQREAVIPDQVRARALAGVELNHLRERLEAVRLVRCMADIAAAMAAHEERAAEREYAKAKILHELECM